MMVTLYYDLVSRIYPDHHDDGGVCAARGHDGHPGGGSACVTDVPSVSVCYRLVLMCRFVPTADE